ncbi:OprD family outer membrane porin [Denitromonas ohlonensis]|uniref:OprD family porin n=2 Tax=Denitromonas TaxID=139331 RepID=A0A557SQM6_9RHOO|nr:OprD family outer membrane porin [Denitromonas ohlonensis]TVO66822.1 OprD family porin [Denitromonas ohlonensis]TVO79692.1 OprD family porin [Denitromonas ohlonensis]
MKQQRIPLLIQILVGSLALAGTASAADTKGHSLELKARGIYFDRDYENDANDRSQSALGLQLNYESPYYWDFVGIGLSGYSVTELGASGRLTSDILSVDKDGDVHDSFGKLGQAFIKLKYQDVVNAKLGRQVHKSMLLSSSGSRAIPNSFSGGTVNVTPMKGLKFYGAMYNEWSPRSDAHFYEFKTDRSAEGDIDYIGLVGVSYDSGPFSIDFEYLKADNFLSKTGLVASYTFALANKSKLKVTGGVHASRDDGDLFVTGSESSELDDEDVAGSVAGTTASDNDGLGVYVAADWTFGNVLLGGALSKFDGAWIEDNFAGDHGTNAFPTGGVLADFSNRDELVWMLKAGYDWKDYIKGLKTTLSYKKGTGARNSHVPSLGEADESEWALDVRYAIPVVKGMALRYTYLDYQSDKTGRLDGVKENERDHRLYLDYTYRFF